MKEYSYKEKKLKVNGKKHTVIIPEKHSIIEKLILETKDLNAWDDYANITHYHTLCMILKKDTKKWEIIFNGDTCDFKINGEYANGIGIFNTLFLLENEKTRNKILRKEEIKFLKNRIKKDIKRLNNL